MSAAKSFMSFGNHAKACPDSNASSRNHAKNARTGGCRSRPGTHSALYPIWTAIGSLGTVFLGFALLGENLTVLKLVSVGLIVAGVVGLK